MWTQHWNMRARPKTASSLFISTNTITGNYLSLTSTHSSKKKSKNIIYINLTWNCSTQTECLDISNYTLHRHPWEFHENFTVCSWVSLSVCCNCWDVCEWLCLTQMHQKQEAETETPSWLTSKDQQNTQEEQKDWKIFPKTVW